MKRNKYRPFDARRTVTESKRTFHKTETAELHSVAWISFVNLVLLNVCSSRDVCSHAPVLWLCQRQQMDVFTSKEPYEKRF